MLDGTRGAWPVLAVSRGDGYRRRDFERPGHEGTRGLTIIELMPSWRDERGSPGCSATFGAEGIEAILDQTTTRPLPLYGFAAPVCWQTGPPTSSLSITTRFSQVTNPLRFQFDAAGCPSPKQSFEDMRDQAELGHENPQSP